MLSEVVDLLVCPVCGGRLDAAPHARALACPAGHSFDVARQGYVSLLSGHTGAGTADSAEMVRARAAFLDAGHFSPLASRLALIASELVGAQTDEEGRPGRRVVDAGAGTGYYLGAVLDDVPDAAGLALDLSKHALRRAARCHDRAGAAVCDLWREIPVRSGVVDVLLNVFAPRNAAEYARMLKPDGTLLVVTPTLRHQQELVGALGLISVDEQKRDRVAQTLGTYFHLEGEESCEMELTLDHSAVETLVAMGPSARHLDSHQLQTRVAALPERVDVTASFTLQAFRAGSA